MTKARSLLVAGLLATGFGLLLSCATSTRRTLETDLAKALVTPDQENQIGLKLKNDMDQTQKVAYLSDPEVVGYVRGVADKVIAQGKVDRPDVVWQVNVIDDPKTVNAFATPGGYLYVYRGLLETAQNEAELAGVMAHETGHVVARHAARSMVDQYGIDAVVGMASGDNPNLVEKVTTSIATNGVMLTHSRADETEADEYGARYAAAAGYDPRGLVSFFQRLQAQEGDQPRLLTYLSDHPATQDRVDHVTAFIVAQNLSGTNLGTEAYARIRKRLSTLPVTTAGAAVPAPANRPPAAPPPANRPPAAPPP